MKSIKDIKAVSVLATPYVDWERKKEHDIYLRSPDHFYLKTMKGIHEGQRCFIIGNGPSLRAGDLDLLNDEYTFAANSIFKIFDQTVWRPTYYLSVDDKVLKEVQHELLNYDCGHIFVRYGKSRITGPTNRITKIYIEDLLFNTNGTRVCTPLKYISEDVSDHFCNGGTVTFESMQLAIYMGFKEIYLLGIDHNYSRTYDLSGKVKVDLTVEDHFDHKEFNSKTAYPANLSTAQYSYTIAREYCDTHGIKIYNATRGGKLEVFERIELDELWNSGGVITQSIYVSNFGEALYLEVAT